jgi:hypothetical protein
LYALAREWAGRPERELGFPHPIRNWSPAGIVFLPDGSDARFRHIAYRGPGLATVRPRFEWRSRAGRVLARSGVLIWEADVPHAPGQPRAISLDEQARLVVYPSAISV